MTVPHYAPLAVPGPTEAASLQAATRRPIRAEQIPDDPKSDALAAAAFADPSAPRLWAEIEITMARADRQLAALLEAIRPTWVAETARRVFEEMEGGGR